MPGGGCRHAVLAAAMAGAECTGPIAIWKACTWMRQRQDDGSEALPLLRLASDCTAMPRPELLETFENPYSDRDYSISMECPEFTSLCPLGGVESDAEELRQLAGGAPDFGTIIIDYVPDRLCLELKSLKLYLWSFRNDGIFYERAVNRILDDLAAACRPRWMEVTGDFNIRGGIKSVITATVEASARDAGGGARGERKRDAGAGTRGEKKRGAQNR